MAAPHSEIRSAIISADGAVTGATRGFFYGVVLSGTAGVCKIYDNSAASGTELLEASALGAYFLPVPIPFKVGLFVDLTSAVVTVLWADSA